LLVRDRLEETMIHNRYERPAHVLLLGENAHDKKFASILAEVLESVMQKKPKVWQEDAEGVAAKGVAKLAKRAP